MTTPRITVGVLGVGSLGKEHARIYAELAATGQVEFVGVHDSIPETAARAPVIRSGPIPVDTS